MDPQSQGPMVATVNTAHGLPSVTVRSPHSGGRGKQGQASGSHSALETITQRIYTASTGTATRPKGLGWGLTGFLLGLVITFICTQQFLVITFHMQCLS